MPFTPRPSVSPPPCWCGRAPSEHGESNPANGAEDAHSAAADHEYDEYVPADGFESEAFDAW
jgi:hypothetical protein